MKTRIRIPKSVSALIDLRSNLKCCVCQRRGQQIHHLDGDPANNVFENLALLCFEHHDEATRTGGLGRKLGAETIRLFRKHWYSRVEADLQPTANLRTGVGSSTYDETLAALAVHEVRKISCVAQGCDRPWAKVQQQLEALLPYASHSDFRVRREVLEGLDGLATQTRTGMPGEVARAICGIGSSTMPAWNVHAPIRRDALPEELEILEAGLALGTGVAYDGAKYLDDIAVVDAGGDLMARVLRLAIVNRLEGLAAQAQRSFGEVADAARTGENPGLADVLTWLAFLNQDAIDPALSRMPHEINAKIQGRASSATA